MTDENSNSLSSRDKAWMEVFRGPEELIAFDREAGSDVTEAIEALSKTPHSQFLRRTAIRNFAAHVEGVIFLTKQFTVALSNVRTVVLNKRELALLAEQESYKDENGQEQRLRYLGFLDNFKFALKTYARVGGVGFKLGCGDPRYEFFREMIEIRDRLMHPKSVRNLFISDEEIIRVGQAWRWYQEEVSRLLGQPTSTVGLRTRFTP